ncbi:MAG: tyrosine-protein phosphatase [Planctomycetes bacterium]|nr:tyrosine-protein phosphatase [Planctomycetota bacterium]
MGNNPGRILPLSGIINFRDLGGYPAADGRRVRWRRLYRSARWTAATPDDAAALAELGIDTVIDFRGEAKRERRPEHIPPGVRRIVHLPIEPVDPVFADDLASIPRSGDAEASRTLMRAFYAEMVTEHADRFRAFFAALVEAQGTVVFHCSAGKDRTGLAAALLLTALGVGSEDVYADYMASGPLIQNAFADFVTRHNEAVRPFVEVDASYLDAAFDTIAREHGSVDVYLRDALQVDVGTLRSLFLE